MRAVRPLLITLAVLGVLFVIADRVAVLIAESMAADELKKSRQIDGDPDVSIKGFPFLTQVMFGELDHVEASAKGVRADDSEGSSLRITNFKANLHDIGFSGGFSSATADHATGSVLISYDDLSAAAPTGVQVSYGGTSDKAGVSEVNVASSIPVVGKVSLTSELSLVDGDTVRVKAKSVPDWVGSREDMVREYTDFDKEITGLPSGLQLTSITAEEDGIRIELEGTNVSLTG